MIITKHPAELPRFHCETAMIYWVAHRETANRCPVSVALKKTSAHELYEARSGPLSFLVRPAKLEALSK